MGLVVTDIKPHIGARVDVERRALLDDDVIAQCLDLLERRGVLVFPRIGLSDEEQLAFTDRLGARSDFTRLEGVSDDGIYRVSLDPRENAHTEYVQATFFWHMDGLTADVIPPKATLLSARRVAAKGGQTEFANTYAAYASLSDEDRADIEGLRAFHGLQASMPLVIDEPTEAHRELWRQTARDYPLVWRHRSGRRSLVLGSTAEYVVGMPKPNGRALLQRLLEWTVQPDFSYRHQWRVGDLVIWDNCGTLHRVFPYAADSGRLMHRTSIEGAEPFE